MIKILLDGFISFQIHFWMVICILLIIVWGQVIMQRVLVKILGNLLTDTEYFPLALAGWVFPVICWSIIYFLVNLIFGKSLGVVISVVLLLLPFLGIRFKKPPIFVTALILFFLLLTLIRLAFLQQALMPLYFDSALHYLNIQNLMNVYETETFPEFSPIYYHLGYHFLSAALIHLFQLNIANFMLVFGQVVLVILPISFFFLLKQITGSNIATFLAFLIAGFGFHMPAHLINWGKYPALLSLVGIQFVFCLLYLRLQSNFPPNQKTKLDLLIIISILITILTHSRSLIVFIVMVIAYLIVVWLKRISARLQPSLFLFLLIILGVEFFYVQQSSALFPLLERYLQKDFWILILALLLAPISIKIYPQSTFFLLTSLSLFILLLFIPISFLNYGVQTPLDRPFVQMLAYIPLTIIIGLEFAGLLQMTQKLPYAKYVIQFIMFGFVLLNMNFKYDFYPSPCCQFVSQNDISAVDWIKENIPLKEKILIAASQLYVTSYEESIKAPVDAGVWIMPVANRETLYEFNNINFGIYETLKSFCNQEIRYIYVGSMPQSFKQIQLASQPDWYQPVFLSPKAQVYQVIGCE